ncbi:hypothetical protein GDO81_000247 [Engystomops pustulosus]|uniref:Uncharacterized protein n=1 Tax=Engystomops pustulosus TaxID=76066 RepID=A0AAV7D2I5_ENGPU|nr:hypothetical protein GDO81_000247 [Engystomops pustulosus]
MNYPRLHPSTFPTAPGRGSSRQCEICCFMWDTQTASFHKLSFRRQAQRVANGPGTFKVTEIGVWSDHSVGVMVDEGSARTCQLYD